MTSNKLKGCVFSLFYKRLKNENGAYQMWYHRTVRLRPQAIQLSSFLQATIPNIKKSELFDIVLRQKLPLLEKEKYIIGEYNNIRTVKGVKLRKDTVERLNKFLDTNKHLLRAEVFEICLYLFAQDHLNKEEREFFKLDEWHVRKKINHL